MLGSFFVLFMTVLFICLFLRGWPTCKSIWGSIFKWCSMSVWFF